jgi:tRNA1(Val) A37 N6-methylase TrmN6
MRLSNDPDDRAARKRPPGWVAKGPPPRGACGRPELAPKEGEVLSFLSGDWRIFQRKDGHRWSLDDFMTAAVAIEEGRALGRVQSACDLGCGIGSVLMFVAWGFPDARAVGVEAQALSASMARRSLAYNGADDRVVVRDGDLRDAALFPEGATFDLVTGTPPYIPLGHGTPSEKTQRGPCCFETRGGIEDYAKAAARLLSPDGLFVACSGAFPVDRAIHAARAAGLTCTRRVSVVGKEGKPPLFVVTVMRRADRVTEDPPEARAIREEVFVARLSDSSLPEEMHRARELLGLPPAIGR